MKKLGEIPFLKKLFGGLDLTWGKVILFAVIAGVYTGVMAMIPALEDTSFQDITTTFECWILFGILLIVNGKSPLDAALKTFVFFLVSQPLVFLVQAPFHELGFGIFVYYRPWFIWTLFTFPMAFIGYYMKKNKWWGLLILGPMLLFLGYHYLTYVGEAVHFFPNHLLTSVFCALTLLIYPVYIFRENKKVRTAGLILSVVILLAASVYGVLDKRSHTYDTSLLLSGSETTGIEYDDTYRVYLEDEAYGTVRIGYEEALQGYLIYASFTKTGDTVLVLESPDGQQYRYDLTVQRSSYTVTRQGW